jgi:hypothetical protein
MFEHQATPGSDIANGGDFGSWAYFGARIVEAPDSEGIGMIQGPANCQLYTFRFECRGTTPDGPESYVKTLAVIRLASRFLASPRRGTTNSRARPMSRESRGILMAIDYLLVRRNEALSWLRSPT